MLIKNDNLEFGHCLATIGLLPITLNTESREKRVLIWHYK